MTLVWVVYRDAQGVERTGTFVRADDRRVVRVVQRVQSIERGGRIVPIATYGERRSYKGTVTLELPRRACPREVYDKRTLRRKRCPRCRGRGHVRPRVRVPRAWVKHVLVRRKPVPLEDFLGAKRTSRRASFRVW